MNPRQLVLPFVAAGIAAVGQLLLRTAMLKVGAIQVAALARPTALIRLLLGQPLLWVAIPVYAVGFLVWLIVLSRLPLSVAYPMLATTYIVIPLLSAVILNETIVWQHWLGFVLICAGVIAIGAAAHAP